MGRSALVGAALSEHPIPSHAVGECVGHLLEVGGTHPDLVMIFATAPQLGALEDVLAATRALLDPVVVVGAGAAALLGGGREVEDRPALAMWALWLRSPEQPLRAVRIGAGLGTSSVETLPGLAELRGAEGTLMVLTDPFTCDATALLEHLGEVAPQLSVVGGAASAARAPGANRLLLDEAIHPDGAVAVLLPPSAPVSTVVSQGCRAIGSPLTITRSERDVIHELAGRPALERLNELVETLGPEDRMLAAHGLRLGLVIDEHRDEFGHGDFLVRSVRGGDRTSGAIAVDAEMPLGSTVQFHVRDAASATQELDAVLRGAAAEGRGSDGALVFTGHGRGLELFGPVDHDAVAVSEVLGDVPMVGMFCAGEFGPIGGRSFVHELSATVVMIG